jgi:ribosomal protein S18 acetylase RimI-like enzyme
MREPRAVIPADSPGVYRVCHETGDPKPGQNPDLLGHVYAGPYLAGQADLARVVADDEGVAGYLLGCADTRAFERWCESNWWPALREQYPLETARPADRDLVALLHRPPRSPESVVREHPAHLHIDLLGRTRGHGFGRVLIEWLCAELAARGIPGVHLGVGRDNANAIAFYGHLGFTEFEADGNTLWMVRRLS